MLYLRAGLQASTTLKLAGKLTQHTSVSEADTIKQGKYIQTCIKLHSRKVAARDVVLASVLLW